MAYTAALALRQGGAIDLGQTAAGVGLTGIEAGQQTLLHR
jgi:hypothetical protein